MTTTVGTSAVRSDGEAKVRGAARFGVDIVLPGMLHAKLLRSPAPAGRLVRVDTSAAAAIDGVRALMTAADVPNQRTGIVMFDMPMFAADYVAYEGEPLAAVVAGHPRTPREHSLRCVRDPSR